MNWDKINIQSILEVLRSLEENSLSLFGEQAIVYSDGIEELKISYKRLKELSGEKA